MVSVCVRRYSVKKLYILPKEYYCVFADLRTAVTSLLVIDLFVFIMETACLLRDTNGGMIQFNFSN